MFNFSEFISTAKRILTVSKKPELADYKVMAKITGLGIVLIAVLGFLITLLFRILSLGR